MKLNVVFLLSIPFPKGMAGSKRVKHAIDGLKEQGVDSSVIITRQSAILNQPNGDYKGTPYETLMPDLIGWRLAIKLPALFFKTILCIRKFFKKNHKNILFIYDHPSIDNIISVFWARQLGYKIVFDIIEDADHAKESSKDIRHRIKVLFNRYLTNRIASMAHGIVVISSMLESKFSRLTNCRVSMHLRPVSIEPKQFRTNSNQFNSHPIMLYSGSFAIKDGISYLLDAYDHLSAKYAKLKLIMTGKGSKQRMLEVTERIKVSSANNRIEFMGYVDDAKYYEILAKSDIPCMTRIDSGYANAGFPFKLGEYLASGKPVIASDVSDVGKTLKDRYEIMLVKPGDSKAIINAVEYLLMNPQKAIEIGQRGREKALKLFDYKIQGIELHRFLNTL